jgi:HPt (histidine-containing phosphotransfer) domain-containing protein
MTGNQQPAFDEDRLWERVDGDRSLLDEIVAVYFEDEPRMVSAIAAAISAADARRLGEAAHALKGAVGNFAAERAQQRAATLEELAHAGNIEEAGAVWESLRGELVKLRADLLRILDKRPPQ